MGLETNDSPLRKEDVLHLLKMVRPRLRAKGGREGTGEQFLEQDRSP